MSLAGTATAVVDVISSSAGSALLGALAGGAATYYASRAQTDRTIKAGTEQYRLAAQEQRELAAAAAAQDRAAAKKQLGTTAVLELLDALAMLDAALPHVRAIKWEPRFPGQDIPPHHIAAYDALDAIRRVEFVALPAIDDPRLDHRWTQLSRLVSEYRGLKRGPRTTTGAAGKQPVKHDGPVTRAQMDVQEFIRYVRASGSAWLHDTPLPPAVRPPALGRNDLIVWRWQEAGDQATQNTVASGQPDP